MELKTRFAHKKLLILVCRAEGKEPLGKTAQMIKYDADVKIWVSGFKAFSHGRFYGETGEKIIWDEGARKAYGTDKKEVEDGQN